MDLVSEQNSERCISGAPKAQLDFKAINLSRHRRLMPLGAARRVLRVTADGNGGDSNPLGDSATKKEPYGISAACSAEDGLASVDASIERSQSNFAESPVVSLDAADARKRKAELDLSGSPEWMHLEHMERRPNPISRAQLLPAADLNNRKAIELAKERFGVQDKENINPGDGYRKRQTRKQASDRSCGEKRGLQVSSKQHNARGNDVKLGSLVPKLMTGDGKPTISDSNLGSSAVVIDLPSEGFLQKVGLAGSIPSLKAAEPISTVPYLSSPRTESSIQQSENAAVNTCESIIISPLPLPVVPSNQSDDGSQPKCSNGGTEEKFPEVDMQLGSKPFISASSSNVPDTQISKILVEVGQAKELPTSVTELSSVMNVLKISEHHCHEDMQILSLSEKAASSHICNVKQSASNIQGQSNEEARCVLSMSGPVGELHQNHGFTGASIATSAPCSPERHIGFGRQQTRSPHSSSCDALRVSSVPSTVANANACSITVRNTSAPLAPFTSMSQPCTGESVQPSRKLYPSSADDILKPSQLNYASLVSAKVQVGPLQEEGRQSSVNGTMLKDGKLSEQGYGRSSHGAVLLSEGDVAKGTGTGLFEPNMPSEKKAISAGDVNLQTRKRGETEHYVWVNGRRYQKLKKIGSGGSSEVYKVIDRDCTIYALKRIKLKGRDYGAACGFYQEIGYLQKLCGQPYIVRLIDHEVTDQRIFSDKVEPSCIIKDDVYIYMVLEYGEIDLAHMLMEKFKERSQRKKDLDETWLRFYWHQILEAVNTIHEERIVHSDLKPANFLLVKGVLKLIDFGIAKAIQSDTTHIERESQVGTVNYMSPEAFLMNEKDEHGNPIKCGRPSDIWSLGCILYQMVYGTTPFAHINRIWAKVQEVTNPNHKINFPPLSNPYLLDIMKKCLAWRLEERLRIPELLNHPFLKPQSAKPLSYPWSKQQKEEILLQIQIDYKRDKEVCVLSAKLLERLRMLESATDE